MDGETGRDGKCGDGDEDSQADTTGCETDECERCGERDTWQSRYGYASSFTGTNGEAVIFGARHRQGGQVVRIFGDIVVDVIIISSATIHLHL